eukprot:3226092-Ditylum_brightwellii.AAC.2
MKAATTAATSITKTARKGAGTEAGGCTKASRTNGRHGNNNSAINSPLNIKNKPGNMAKKMKLDTWANNNKRAGDYIPAKEKMQQEGAADIQKSM